jgi:hypothetical protein
MFGLNHLGQQKFNAGIACAALSGAAVVMRVFCKVRHKQGIRSDDWWIIVALAWYWASVSVVIWGKSSYSWKLYGLQLMTIRREHNRRRR